MLGKPREHVEQTLKSYINRLKEEGEIGIFDEHFAPAEEKGSLFSTFVDFEGRFKDINQLIGFCFDAMPSSIDILEPAELNINTKDLTDLLNDLQARLHNADMELKATKARQIILDKNVMNIFHNFIKWVLKDGEKPLEELSSIIGVKPEELLPFLERLVESGIISRDGDTFRLSK